MKARLLIAVAAAGAAALLASPANAQATRTWVSGVGDDVNPCSRTAPCKTFAGAISKTAINGEINCLDPGGFGTVTITKSLTIDCHEVFASALASGTTGIIINVATGNADDPQRTVRLRNININGAGASGAVGTRTGLIGIRILSAATVFIDDVLISDFTQQGINDVRGVGGELYVTNTIVRNNTLSGIVVNGTGTGVNAMLDNVKLLNNGFGLAVGGTNSAVVRRSVISGNATGIEVDPNGVVSVDNSSISGNDNGVQTFGTIRLSNNDIFRNGTAFINNSAIVYGNNRVLGNTTIGTAATPAGAPSNTFGQQ